MIIFALLWLWLIKNKTYISSCGPEDHHFINSHGSTLAEYPLDSLPVFDGLIAANGRLYLVTTDGKLRCYAGVK